MVDVVTEIVINKPIQIVASYAVNPDNAPEWYVNIKSVKWKTPKPLKIGSKVAFVAHFLGRKLFYTYEFTELAPQQRLVMRTVESPISMETTYTWTAIDKRTTKMTLRNKGNTTGFFKLFAPFIGAMVKRANKKDLTKIKKILEAK